MVSQSGVISGGELIVFCTTINYHSYFFLLASLIAEIWGHKDSS